MRLHLVQRRRAERRSHLERGGAHDQAVIVGREEPVDEHALGPMSAELLRRA